MFGISIVVIDRLIQTRSKSNFLLADVGVKVRELVGEWVRELVGEWVRGFVHRFIE